MLSYQRVLGHNFLDSLWDLQLAINSGTMVDLPVKVDGHQYISTSQYTSYNE
jgi:hypothetical protein